MMRYHRQLLEITLRIQAVSKLILIAGNEKEFEGFKDVIKSYIEIVQEIKYEEEKP